MSTSQLQFLNSSSEEDIESVDGIPDGLPFGCSKMDQSTSKNPPINQPAKRSRNGESSVFNTKHVKEQQLPSDTLLKAQIDIQKKLYDAVTKSLEDNKENSKLLQHNTRRMYEALDRIGVGSLDLIRAVEAQNIEEARHHKVMENIAKEELKINQKLLELKIKKEQLRTT